MKKNLIFLVAITVLIGFASAAKAQNASARRSNLVGTWKLISANQRMDDGTLRPDPQPGPNGVGYIIYTENGHMCALLANPDRRKWESINAPTDAELRDAMNGMVAYCGTYEVNEKEGYVLHHIEFDRVPNLAGTDRRRLYAINGKRLVLRPTPLPVGIKDWNVEWERVGN